MSNNPFADAFEQPGEHNNPVLSVSELSGALKRTVEDAFSLVRVRGEISGFKRAASGHMYLALKDENAVMDGVCWKGTAARLALQPQDGMEVICKGRLTTYPGRSKYQIVIESMELAGEGALLKLLEDLKRKLAAEGLFAPDRKKPIPFLPEVIGVVTSPTGAVIRDILHRLGDRFPRHVLLWPVLVQGKGAAEQVASAIRGFNGLPAHGAVPRPDLLIVARGGGSLEDLWAFNEEPVVRAAAESDIPLISAVGHETDTTLIDFASDQRAPTPTAAAEMAVPVRMELMAQVKDDEARLLSAMRRLQEDKEVRLQAAARGIPHPERLVQDMEQRLDDRVERLLQAGRTFVQNRTATVDRLTASIPHPEQVMVNSAQRLAAESRAMTSAFERTLESSSARFERVAALLESYSYKSVLERGFLLATDTEGKALTQAKDARKAEIFNLHFSGDEQVEVTVHGESAPKPRKRKPRPEPKPDQGSLF